MLTLKKPSKMKSLIKNMKIHFRPAACMVAALAAMTFTACNDDVERTLKEEYPEPGITDYQTGKVLWIVMDGASGIAVKQAYNNKKAPNIRKMLENSVYTFEGLADTHAEDTITNLKGWQNLLTGSTDAEGQPISILKRLKESKADSRTALFASDDSFYNLYAADADTPFNGENDGKVMEQAVAALSATDEAAPDFSIIEFDGVEKAGRASGFYDEEGQYATEEVLTAVSVIDGYIARITKALQARPNYKRENWMVMVTSNYGGLESNEGDNVYEMKDRNIFSMLWSSRINSKLLQKPLDDELSYSYYAPIFSNKGLNETAGVHDPELFNMHPDSSYTVQFMFREFYTKANIGGKNSASGNQTLVSKTEDGKAGWIKGMTGWKVLWSGSKIMVYCSNLNNSRYRAIHPTTNLRSDNDWHVFTMVLDRQKAHMYTYVDGVSEGRTEDPDLDLKFEDRGEAVSDLPLRIGVITGSVTSGNTQFAITNLQVYDVALPAEYVAKNYSQTALDKVQNQYWDNLTGYWPVDREEDLYLGTLRDYSQYAADRNGESDMDITGDWITAASWRMGSSQSKNATAVPSSSYYQKVINTVDLSFQTFQWLGIPVGESWGWEGIARPLPYNNLETTN